MISIRVHCEPENAYQEVYARWLTEYVAKKYPESVKVVGPTSLIVMGSMSFHCSLRDGEGGRHQAPDDQQAVELGAQAGADDAELLRLDNLKHELNEVQNDLSSSEATIEWLRGELLESRRQTDIAREQANEAQDKMVVCMDELKQLREAHPPQPDIPEPPAAPVLDPEPSTEPKARPERSKTADTPPKTVRSKRQSKLDPWLSEVGVICDTEIAKLAGVTSENVRAYRKRHSIPAFWRGEQ